jgi:hypothetical protein
MEDKNFIKDQKHRSLPVPGREMERRAFSLFLPHGKFVTAD